MGQRGGGRKARRAAKQRRSGRSAPPMPSLRRVFDDDDVIRLLRSEVEKAGGQAALPREAGVSRGSLNNILSGKRAPTKQFIKALKLRSVFVPE